MRTGEVLASPVFLYIAADMVHTAPVDYPIDTASGIGR